MRKWKQNPLPVQTKTALPAEAAVATRHAAID